MGIKRDRYAPEIGKELREDDSILDVTAWRDEIRNRILPYNIAFGKVEGYDRLASFGLMDGLDSAGSPVVVGTTGTMIEWPSTAAVLDIVSTSTQDSSNATIPEFTDVWIEADATGGGVANITSTITCYLMDN